MGLWSRMRSGWRNLVRKRQAEDDLDAELRSYVEMITDEFVASGMSRAEARRKALAEAGGAEQVKQAVRNSRTGAGLESLWQNLRYAVRQLSRTRVFTGTVILTLGLGIGATTAMFSVIRAVLLRPLAYSDPDRLVLLTRGATPIRYEATQAGEQSYTALGAYAGGGENVTLSGGGVPEMLEGARVSANFLEILGVPPVAGRGFLPAEDQPGAASVAMISTRLWQRRFGENPAVIGRVVTLSGVDTTIVGVLPAGFRFPRENVDVWVPRPAEWSAIGAISRPISPILTMFGRLRPNVSLEQARSELAVLQHAYAAAHPAMLDAETHPAPDVRLMKEELVAGFGPKLWMLFGAVILVLLIVCANVACLLLARAAARTREFAVRAAIGAGRGRIIAQLLTESVLLALAGGGLGIVVAEAGVRVLRGATSLDLPRQAEIGIDGTVLLCAVLASLLTGLIFGMAPALIAARPDLGELLRGGGSRSVLAPQRSRLRGTGPRDLLVLGQMALSTILLIGTALLIESLNHAYRADPGFEVAHLLTMDLDLPVARYATEMKRAAFYKNLVSSLGQIPGVENAAITRTLPMRGWAGVPLGVSGRPELKLNKRPIAVIEDVSPGYFVTMKIPLLRGRVFSPQDDADAPPVALLNQAAARLLWPQYPAGESPIGQHLLIGAHSKPTEVVGIVGSVRQSGLESAAEPGVYRAAWQQPPETAMVAVRTSGDPTAVIDSVRSRVLALDHDQPISHVASMRQVVDDSEGQLRAMTTLLAVFAGLASAIAVVGIYGLCAYVVVQRRREMGIRLALGETRSGLLRWMLGHAARLILFGSLTGVAGAWLLSRTLASLLVGITPHDGASFALAWALITITALAACLVPAADAARTDLVAVLRAE